MEGIPSYEELYAKARPVLGNKRVWEIVEIAKSPNNANDMAIARRFKRENVLGCHALARIKKYYPDKYEELKNKKAKPVLAKVEAPVSVSKPPKPNWRQWAYIGVAVVVCLSLALVGVLARGGNDQKTSEPVVASSTISAVPQEMKLEKKFKVVPPPNITHIDPALKAPQLLAPYYGALDQPFRGLGFAWSKTAEEPYEYEFVLSKLPGFEEDEVELRVFTPHTGLAINFDIAYTDGGHYSLWSESVYFWRVRTINISTNVASKWSDISTFKTVDVPR